MSFTFETSIELSCSAMPPLMFFCGLGRTFFLTIATCSTSTRPFPGNTRSTRPSLPLSRPAMTLTWSLRRMSYLLCIMIELFEPSFTKSRQALQQNFPSQNFGRERNDLQELFFAQFPSHGTKYARANRLPGFIDQHRRILIEADVGAVAAPRFLAHAHHYGLDHGALLCRSIWGSFLHRSGNYVAQSSPQAARSAQRQNHLQLACAGVIGDLQH